jgi:hypothetical protein
MVVVVEAHVLITISDIIKFGISRVIGGNWGKFFGYR